MKDTKGTVHYAGNDFFIGISPSGHTVTMDMDKDRSSAPTPVELLIIALGGCTGVDVVSILEKKRMTVTSYRIEVHGDRREEHPRSFRRFDVKHIIKGTGLTDLAVKQAVELSTEKYCSVAATFRPTAEIVTSYEIL